MARDNWIDIRRAWKHQGIRDDPEYEKHLKDMKKDDERDKGGELIDKLREKRTAKRKIKYTKKYFMDLWGFVNSV